MTAESSDQLYEQVWGEAPHAPAPDPSDGQVEPPAPTVAESHIAASEEPAAGNGSTGSTVPASAAPEPRGTTMLQHQMAETLRRLEARVGDLQQQVQPFTKTTVRESIQAAQGVSADLSKATLELKGMIEYAHRIVQELADIQAEARRGMAVINERIKELERPRRFFT